MSSDFDRYLRYKRPEGFKFEFPADKKFVWIRGGDGAHKSYVAAEVIDTLSGQLKVRIKDSIEERTVADKEAEGINPAKFDGVDDCALLGYLSQPSVLHNLRLRYDANVIYTYSGLFLVSVNPYKWFPIYTEEIIKRYKNKRRTEVPPHVYALADEAYRNVLKDGKSQSMLVTGESGAGKTENTKKIIQYLASICGKTGTEGTLEKQLLQANPLLEAVGNAKTLKNNNSSRFGKFIKITFDSGGFISGSEIVSYLLEKSRVVTRGKGERSFHIFYQLFNGIPAELRSDYQLTNDPSNYIYLRRSECYLVDGIDDEKEYKSTMFAMETLGFTSSEREMVYRVCAGILHFGNVKFSGDEQAQLVDMDPLQKAAQLWRVNPEALKLALIAPRITVGRERIAKGMTPDQAERSRDALTKALYGRMFLWIVQKINDTLKVKPRDNFIGILDIAGFEIFEHNSFEQLCINFTNERLQQFFNNHMFHLEQEEYKRENISWTFINFGVDSMATIDLIQKKPRGLLIILDEECVFPKATDKTFVEKLVKTHEGRNPKFRHSNLGSETSFGIDHYAGSVKYDATAWLEKNKDPLQDDIEYTLRSSSDQLLVNFFTTFAVNRTKGSIFLTVGSFYREQLDDLMNTLQSTYPHFVRCIIPNHKQVPGVIDDSIVLDQLACNGVLEGIRISRLGFPNRMVYSEFLKRYYLLHQQVSKSAPDAKDAVKKIVQKLISDGNIVEDNVRYGITKIFFRAGEMAKVEELREKVVGAMIDVIQACARGYVARKVYERIRAQKKAAVIIGKAIRGWLDLRKDPWWDVIKKLRSAQYQRIAQREAIEKQARDKIAKIEEERQAVLTAISAVQQIIEQRGQEQQELEIQIEDSKRRLHRRLVELDETRSGVRELESEEDQKLKDLREKERQISAGKLEEQDWMSQIRSIETNIKAVEADSRKLTEQIAKDRVELEKINKSIEEQKSIIRTLESDSNYAQQQYDMRTDDIHNLIERKGVLLREKAEFEHNLTLAQQEKSQKIVDISAAEKKLEGFTSDLKKLNEQVDALKKQVKEANLKTMSLQSGNQNLSLKLENEASVGKRFQQEIQLLNSDSKSKQESIDNERKFIRDLTEKLKETSVALAAKISQTDQTSSEKEKTAATISATEASIAQKQKELELAKEKIMKLSAEIYTLNLEVQKLTEENEDLASKTTKAQKLLAQLNTTRDELNAKIKTTTDETEKSEKMKIKIENSIKSLTSDLQTVTQNKEKALTHQTQLTTTKNSISEEFSQTKSQVDEMSRQVNQQKAALLEVENSLSLQSSQNNMSGKKVQHAEQQLHQLRIQREDLEREANNLVSFREKLSTIKIEMLSKLDNAVQSNSLLQQKLSQAQSRVDDLTKSFQKLDKDNNSLEKNLVKLDQEEKRKKEELKAASEKLDEANVAQNYIEGEIKHYQAELSDLENEIHEVNRKIRVNNQLIEEQQNALDRLAQTISELETKENSQLSARISELKENLAYELKVKQKLRERESDLEDLIQARRTEISQQQSQNLTEELRSKLEKKIEEERALLDQEEKAREAVVAQVRDIRREVESIKRNISSAKEDCTSAEKDREHKVARLAALRKELEGVTNVNNKLEYKVKMVEKRFRTEVSKQQAVGRQPTAKISGNKSQKIPEENQDEKEKQYDEEAPKENSGEEKSIEEQTTQGKSPDENSPEDKSPDENSPEDKAPEADEKEKTKLTEKQPERPYEVTGNMSIEQKLSLAKDDIRKYTNERKNHVRATEYFESQARDIETQIRTLHDAIRDVISSKSHAATYQTALKEEIDLLKGGIEADHELKPAIEQSISTEQDPLAEQLKKRISEGKSQVEKLEKSCQELRTQIMSMKVELDHDVHHSSQAKAAVYKTNHRVRLAETDVNLYGATRNHDSPVHLPSSMNIVDTPTTIRRDTLRTLKIIKKLQKYLENLLLEKEQQDNLTWRLRDQVNSLREEYSKVHLDKINSEKERETLRTLLKGQESWAQETQFDHDKKKRQVFEHFQEINNLRGKVEQLQEENSDLEKASDKRVKTRHELQMQLESAVQRNQSTIEETENLEAARKRLKKELLGEYNYRVDAESASTKLHEQLEKSQSEMRIKRSEMTTIEREIEELTQECNSAQLEIHKFERKEDVSQEALALEKQIDSYKEHIAKERERVNHIRINIREKESEVDALKFDIKTLRYDLSVVKADIRKQVKAQSHLNSLIDHFKGGDESDLDEIRA